MPLEESIKALTAFATPEGVFEFNRASMGLLNSAWYFHGTMESLVLKGMVHQILELYIDDILTWAQSPEELWDRLERILNRLEEYKLYLNPEKCQFGMSEVEFVGHLIDESGITFTEGRKQEIAKFPVPQTKGSLKSFLGMAGYFRLHIEDYDQFESPLQARLHGYEKKHSGQPLTWTDEQAKQFEDCRQAVINCRKLFYENPDLPVRVYTDASEYGIGAYLCQVDEEGEEIPIEFISKTLTKSEKKWSTYEKEGYGIFYALRKWETYLKDRRFTLFTDHKNLTYIAKDPNAKVMRWRMAVQDYDFDIAYIPGEENFIADGFSRLCPRSDEAVDQLVDTATASIAALFANSDLIDEWKTIRNVNAEKQHIHYHLDSETIREFKELDRFDRCVRCYSTSATEERQAIKQAPFKHIPQNIFNIIEKVHNHEIGHWGVNRTVELVNELLDKTPEYQNLKWLKKRADIQTFIKKCDCCIKMNEQKLKYHTNKYTTSDYGVMKCLAIDAIYMPYETTRKNKYIMTVIDTFTRYTTLYPMKDLTAQTAAKVLQNHMCVYGVPEKITTDNSSQFQDVFEEMLGVLQSENYKIHAYSHQENGIVERANKEAIKHLRNLAYECREGENWDEHLLKVQAILNERRSEATGLKPTELLFVGQVNLFEGRIFPHPSPKQRQRMSSYMKEQLDLQDKLMEFAEKQQETANEKHLADAVDTEVQHKVGEYVVIRPESGQTADKLKPRLHGPYRITEVHPRPQGTVYTCYSPKNGKFYDFHYTFMEKHPCRNDMEATMSAVLDDNETFIVNEVVDHEIITDKRNKRFLNLMIIWYGNKKAEKSGMNSDLKKNYKVQQYLKTHGLDKEFGVKLSPIPIIKHKNVSFRDDTKKI
jgi:cleavage and polyadenylation specificity factor subunit 1